MKQEYHEGPETWDRFKDGMKKLFQAKKPKSPFTPPKAKPKEKTSKD